MDASGTTQTPQNESDHAEPVQIAQGADASVVEIAQAPAAGLEGAVGQISNIFGTVSVVRADGTRVEAGMGAPIFEGDLIVTETGSEVEVVFADGTNAFLDQEGRLLVERVTPNAPPGESSAFFVVLEGAFTFSAPADTGNGAGNIDVRTPVATVNVQGGRVAGRAAPEAELNLFTLVRNFDGSLGRILISTTAGTLALTTELQAAEVFSLFREPDGGQVPIDQLTAVIGERTMNLIGGSPTGDPVASGPRGSEFVQVAQNNLQQNDAQSFGNGGPNPLGFGRETAFLDNVRGGKATITMGSRTRVRNPRSRPPLLQRPVRPRSVRARVPARRVAEALSISVALARWISLVVPGSTPSRCRAIKPRSTPSM